MQGGRSDNVLWRVPTPSVSPMPMMAMMMGGGDVSAAAQKFVRGRIEKFLRTGTWEMIPLPFLRPPCLVNGLITIENGLVTSGTIEGLIDVLSFPGPPDTKEFLTSFLFTMHFVTTYADVLRNLFAKYLDPIDMPFRIEAFSNDDFHESVRCTVLHACLCWASLPKVMLKREPEAVELLLRFLSETILPNHKPFAQTILVPLSAVAADLGLKRPLVLEGTVSTALSSLGPSPNTTSTAAAPTSALCTPEQMADLWMKSPHCKARRKNLIKYTRSFPAHKILQSTMDQLHMSMEEINSIADKMLEKVIIKPTVEKSKSKVLHMNWTKGKYYYFPETECTEYTLAQAWMSGKYCKKRTINFVTYKHCFPATKAAADAAKTFSIMEEQVCTVAFEMLQHEVIKAVVSLNGKIFNTAPDVFYYFPVEAKKVKGDTTSLPTPIFETSASGVKLLSLDPVEISRQLCILVSSLYDNISVYEFAKTAWNKNQAVCPNLMNFINFSTKTSNWVVQEITREPENPNRIAHFIAIANNCLKLNNFQSCFDIAMKLQSPEVSRLTTAWEALPSSAKQTFNSLVELVDPSKEHKTYFPMLGQAVGPCIPFMGSWLKQLALADEALELFITEQGQQRVNFSYMTIMGKIYKWFAGYQQLKYNFTPVTEIQTYLVNQP
ncbi:ras GEF [Pelomyxa schiedti]|nr:ras GEF [Pelomyxa schiedti]